MPIQLDLFLLILRVLFIILLYLFLMQVVIVITKDLRKSTSTSANAVDNAPPVLGHLVVVDSGPTTILPGTRFDLRSRTTVGRGPTNTIQMTDDSFSSEHTRLWNQNGMWFVQDADSKNGTWVNNQPAVNALPAKIGDIIQIGFITFKLTQ